MNILEQVMSFDAIILIFIRRNANSWTNLIKYTYQKEKNR